MCENPQGTGPAPVDSATLADWVRRLATIATQVTDTERIDQLRALEQLKSAAAAAQATVTVAFADSQHSTAAAAGTRAADRGRGVAAQVALARRDSPGKGGRHLGLATALVNELPRTLAALQTGQISEWRATLIARETACLSAEHRRLVDAELADRLATLGDKATALAARRAAYRLDPAAALNRASRAETDRRVSLRPAPDTMTVLTALLPMKHGVATYAALTRHTDTLKASGDPRTRGQLMADTLVQRVTGQAHADQTDLRVTLLVTDHTLLAGGDQPAHLDGYGPVPAPLARRLLHPDTTSPDHGGADTDDTGTDGTGTDDTDGTGTPQPDTMQPGTTQPDTMQPGTGGTETEHAKVWLRRLYTHPGTGHLVALESTRRLFPAGLRRLLVYRDQFCRTPWCGAPIRHADHVVPATRGGPTSAGNGQGLCQACNQTKRLPGWTALPNPHDGTVQTTTPTGHSYTSHPPPPPGHPLPATAPPSRLAQLHPPAPESRPEHHLRKLIEAAA
jgi:hypothetical protein